jgi:hypothetical protein
LLDVALVGLWVLGRQDSGAGSETVAQRVERRTLLAGFGARAGGAIGCWFLVVGGRGFWIGAGIAVVIWEPPIRLWRGRRCGRPPGGRSLLKGK